MNVFLKLDLVQNIVNVAMYIPVGILLPLCFRYFEKVWRVIVVAAVCSVGIEVAQGELQIGYAEVNAVLNNVIGALLIFIMR